MGVGALELALDGAERSPYTFSRNEVAEKMVASDGSDALIVCSSAGLELQSRRFWPRDRKMTSRASWVNPR